MGVLAIQLEGFANNSWRRGISSGFGAEISISPEHKRTPGAIKAAQEEAAAMRNRASELTQELDEEGLLDWSLCNPK